MTSPPSIRVRGGSASLRGPRSENEDRALVLLADPPGRPASVAMVADGLGDTPHGERAAEALIDGLHKALTEVEDSRPLDPRWVGDTVRGLNDAIFEEARAEGSDGRGTTLALVAVGAQNETLVAHVGDSRVYRLDPEGLHLLTSDHTHLAEAVKRGRLNPDDVIGSPARHALSRAIGPVRGVEVEVIGPLAPGPLPCVYLVITDGVWGPLPDRSLKWGLLQIRDPVRIAEEVVGRALATGGNDNATAAVLRIDPD